VDNLKLIEIFEKAMVILQKSYGERSIEEDEWVDSQPNLNQLLNGDLEGNAENLNTVNEEIARLKAIMRFTNVEVSANQAAPADDHLDDPTDPEAAMNAELAALEKNILEQYRAGRAQIAEKYGRTPDSLEPMKLPYVRKNTGLRTGYGAYLSEQFNEEDKEELRHDSKQIGSIIARKAATWNLFGKEEKEEYERKAHAYNEQLGRIAPFSLETKAHRYNLLSSCLLKILFMLREECGVESICFVAPSNTGTAFNPRRSGLGSGNIFCDY
ncbi:hypothetical protein INT45_008799, partial [Circinella minor]